MQVPVAFIKPFKKLQHPRPLVGMVILLLRLHPRPGQRLLRSFLLSEVVPQDHIFGESGCDSLVKSAVQRLGAWGPFP